MIRLVIEADEGNQQLVDLEQDELEIVIGRGEGSNILLRERNVSRRHAILSKTPEGIYVEDYSRYGTKLNGERLEEAEPMPFGPGDEITIGDYILTLEDDNLTAVEDTGNEEPQILPVKHQPKLVIVSSNYAGEEFPVELSEVIIGRTPDNDIVIDDRSISRHHAKIVQKDHQEFEVHDLESSNGVKVNERQVPVWRLSSGDIIQLGQVRFRFCEPGENFFFVQEDPVPTPPPPNTGNKVMFAVAGGVLLLIIIVAAVFLSGEKDVPKSNKGGDQATQQGPNLVIATDADADIAGKIKEAQAYIANTSTHPQVDETLRNMLAKYPDHAAAKNQSADVMFALAQAQLQAANLSGATTSKNTALAYNPTHPGALGLGVKITNEQTHLNTYALIEASLIENAHEKCKIHQGELSIIIDNSTLASQKATMRAPTMADALVTCIESGHAGQARIFIRSKSWSKAKAEAEALKLALPQSPVYAQLIKKIEDAKKKPKVKDPVTPIKDPKKSTKTNKAEAAKLAQEGKDLVMSSPNRAVKKYKKAVKLDSRNKSIRKAYAFALERAQRYCDAAKQYKRAGKQSKATSLAAKEPGCTL